MANNNIEYKKVSACVDIFRKNLADLEAKMAKIDEEFRLKAEKKKADMAKSAEICRNEIKFWEENVLPRYENCDMTNLPEEGDSSDTLDEEDKVVDTQEEAVNVSADEPEFDSAGFTAEDNTPQVAEPTDVENEELPELDNVEDPSTVVEEINIKEEMKKEAENVEVNHEFPVEEGMTEEAETVATDDDPFANFFDEWAK